MWSFIKPQREHRILLIPFSWWTPHFGHARVVLQCGWEEKVSCPRYMVTDRYAYVFCMITLYIYHVHIREKVQILTFSFTETGSIAIIHWFIPEGKKPGHFPLKSSFPFFGVEPMLLEKQSSLMVCTLHVHVQFITNDLVDFVIVETAYMLFWAHMGQCNSYFCSERFYFLSNRIKLMSRDSCS